jgi:hypothetical protein
MSYLVALSKSLLLMLLIGIPYLVYHWAKTNRPTRSGVLTGATVGLVVYPASLGLYLLGFLLPVFGMPLALLGGALALLHGTPGYQLSIFLGFNELGVVVHGAGSVWIGLLNGVFWSPIYSLVGLILDKKFLRYVSTI